MQGIALITPRLSTGGLRGCALYGAFARPGGSVQHARRGRL